MSHIKFAGLASEWSIDYAKAYAEKLFDMGFSAKAMAFGTEYIVAYSYKPFSRNEANEALGNLSQNVEGEQQE